MRKNIGFLTGTQSGFSAERSHVTSVAARQIKDLAKPKAAVRKKKQFRDERLVEQYKTIQSPKTSCSPG